jgi:hypothetical protein
MYRGYKRQSSTASALALDGDEESMSHSDPLFRKRDRNTYQGGEKIIWILSSK